MRVIAGVITLGMLMGIGTAQAEGPSARWAAPDDATARYIIHIEKPWSDTSCGPAQPDLPAAIAEDFQGTSPKGERYDKSHALEAGNARDCQLGQVKVRLFGGSLAVVYGSESSLATEKDGKTRKHCLIWTDTWLKRDGKWQIIAAQDNAVAC